MLFHILNRRVNKGEAELLHERIDNLESDYKCSRCGGVFGSYNENIVRCPFCDMVCDEVKYRISENSREE